MSRPIRRPDDPDLANLFDAATKTPKVQPQNATELRAHSIANITELRKTPGSNDGNGGPRAIMLAGQLTPNDAGSGTFVWDSTSTLADNAQITASAFTVAQVASVSMGRWVRMAARIADGTLLAGSIIFPFETAPPNSPLGMTVYANIATGALAAVDTVGNRFVLPFPGPAPANQFFNSLDNAGNLISAQPLGSSGFQVFTSSGTYTPSAGTRFQIVQGWGGGGGGGSTTNSATQSSAGGGGGSGGYWIRRYNIVAGSGTGTVTIGAAGVGGSSGTSGGTGGSTVFTDGTNVCTANGGFGGTGAGAGVFVNQGGAPAGPGTGGTFNGRGQPGLYGVSLALGAAGGGQGGSTAVGAGAVGLTITSTGQAGANGGGGAGGTTINNGGVVSGGAGGAGIVIITEFA
jgi:hypothetical protein